MRRAAAALAVLVVAVAMPAAAHSLKELEAELNKRERHGQFVGYPAPDFRLVDTSGQPLGLSDLRGKVVVLNFIATDGKGASASHMALLARLQSMVKLAGMDEAVQFISVAIDREDLGSVRQRMREHGKRFGLDGKNWRFVSRAEDDPADTAVRLAHAYKLGFSAARKEPQMPDVVMHVIDQTGQLRARFHGLKFEPVNLVSYVNALVNDDHSR